MLWVKIDTRPFNCYVWMRVVHRAYISARDARIRINDIMSPAVLTLVKLKVQKPIIMFQAVYSSHDRSYQVSLMRA